MELDKLAVWVRAQDFELSIYQDVIPCLPEIERWNPAQPLRRAAQSIAASIAEGHGRYHFLDNVRFCYSARGSLTEMQSHIHLAHKLGYVPADAYDRTTRAAVTLGEQLNAYIVSLKRTKSGAELPGIVTALREPRENHCTGGSRPDFDEHDQ
jgi:four helix bundle protein